MPRFNQQRNLFRDDTAEVAGNAIDTFEYGVVLEFMHDRFFFLGVNLRQNAPLL